LLCAKAGAEPNSALMLSDAAKNAKPSRAEGRCVRSSQLREDAGSAATRLRKNKLWTGAFIDE
jgi:hypothetical protein